MKTSKKFGGEWKEKNGCGVQLVTEWWNGICRMKANSGYCKLSKGASTNEANKTVRGKGDKRIGKCLEDEREAGGPTSHREATHKTVTGEPQKWTSMVVWFSHSQKLKAMENCGF